MKVDFVVDIEVGGRTASATFTGADRLNCGRRGGCREGLSRFKGVNINISIGGENTFPSLNSDAPLIHLD